MNRIEGAFKKDKAFIPFITAGDPDLETTEKLLYQLEKAGANLIEIGIPFSDPIAEGIVIEKANERALKNQITVDDIFSMLHRIKGDIKVPLVFLIYLNSIYTYGKEKFFERLKECKVEGLIIPDLPYEEREELLSESNRYQIPIITLIAPTSKERIKMLVKEAKGFIYLVSSLGVTGVREEIKTDLLEMILEIRKVSSLPIAIGFGISTLEQGKYFSNIADGVIVGSAIVKLIEAYGRASEEVVYQYAKEMKDGIQDERQDDTLA